MKFFTYMRISIVYVCAQCISRDLSGQQSEVAMVVMAIEKWTEKISINNCKSSGQLECTLKYLSNDRIWLLVCPTVSVLVCPPARLPVYCRCGAVDQASHLKFHGSKSQEPDLHLHFRTRLLDLASLFHLYQQCVWLVGFVDNVH